MKPYNLRLLLSEVLVFFAISFLFFSCEKGLEQKVFDRFSSSTFFKNADDAQAAVTASYRGLKSLWSASNYETVAQSSMSTDELVCSWGWPGWKQLNDIDLSADFPDDVLFSPYNSVMPNITEITIDIEKIKGIEMDENLKNRYVGELLGLRAIYSWMLYNLYGPVPIRIDPTVASDPNAQPIERPTTDWMVKQIESDFNAAASILPDKFTGEDYGRITSTACLTGLLKLYMHEKDWDNAITVGEKIKGMGYSLTNNYIDNFTSASKSGNNEIILTIPARSDVYSYTWTMCALPSNYVDPRGQLLNEWGGYKMPWPIYGKFDPNDKRSTFLFKKYPSFNGQTFDAEANGYIGAIPMKYQPEIGAAQGGENVIVWRYADVMLLLSEALNEKNDGPNQEAYSLINQVRERAGLEDLPNGLNKDQFLNKLMDERLFELWCEGSRREDMIRWGTYIKRAQDAGSSFVKPEFVLYPLPRKVIDESQGVVKQNPGYN